MRDFQDVSLARAALWCLAKLSSQASKAAVAVGGASEETELIRVYTSAIVDEILEEVDIFTSFAA